MASVLSPASEPEVSVASAPQRIRAWQVGLVGVFLIGGFTLLFRLEDAKSLGSHEGYAIVPAREMLLSGDYIVPRFGEMPRLKKPPLIYWTIIASAKATGELAIWTARLPVALTGLILGALMARWAWQWYGGIAAVGAAAAQLTSTYVLVFARKCEADMILVLLIALAMWLVVTHHPAESRRVTFLRWVGIWSCVAISWLGKFHFAPVMIVTPVVAWLILERRWRFLLGLFNPVGLAVLAVAVGVWPLLVLNRMPEAWAIWQEETIGRAVGELGRQPVWYYLPHLVTWTLPWTLFAVLAWPESGRRALGSVWSRIRNPSRDRDASHSRENLVQRWNRLWCQLIDSGDPRERFLWVWLGVSLAIVSVSANKHPHYILPALPAFSLWTARRFGQLEQQAIAGKRLLPWSLAASISVAAMATLAGLVLFRDRLPENLPLETLLPLIGVAGMGVSVAGWLLYSRCHRSAAAVAGGTWVVACGIALTWTIPEQDHRRGAYHFASEVRSRYGDSAEIGLYGIDKDAALWYLGEPAFRSETPRAIAERLERSSRLRLLTITGQIPVLNQVGRVQIVERFRDRPGFPKVELGHYREMVLLELQPRTSTLSDRAPLAGRD